MTMNSFCKIVLLFMLTQAVMGEEDGDKNRDENGDKNEKVLTTDQRTADQKAFFNKCDVNKDGYIDKNDLSLLRQPAYKERFPESCNEDMYNKMLQFWRSTIERFEGKKVNEKQYLALRRGETPIGYKTEDFAREFGLDTGKKYTIKEILTATGYYNPPQEPIDGEDKLVTVEEFVKMYNRGDFLPDGVEESTSTGCGCGMVKKLKDILRIKRSKKGD